MTKILDIFETTGQAFLGFLASLGALINFTAKALSHIVRPPYYFGQLGRQLIDIGFYSLPVVGLTTAFSGMVMALQSNSGFEDFAAESSVANVVVFSITRELAPVLAGLMVAGRIGASMAAELGTMRVTEQIDALTTLATNPMKYLVVPRIVAGILMLPVLVLVGDIIGIFGGYIVAIYKLDFNAGTYIQATYDSLDYLGVMSGIVKAAVFGFLVSLMGCYHGYNSGRGAQGVGIATTNAVVSSSILILISNYLITEAFFGV